MVIIELLEWENHWYFLRQPPISIASFYQVDETNEVNTTTKSRNITDYLTNRAVDILKANPWLCGRLISGNINNDNKATLCLSYNEEVSNPLTFVHKITSDELFRYKNWKNIGAIISMFKPKVGNLCLNKNEHLCAFLIIRNTALTELALVFSLNHSIGDGYTLYYLWKMLDINEPVRQMQVHRDYKFMDYLKRDTNFQENLEESQTIVNQLKIVLGPILRSIGRLIRLKSPPRINMFTVNSEEIKRIKEENNTDNSFVSTNDILNSWFFGSAVCDADNILMTMDMRRRLPEIRENMAGNYQITVLLRKRDVENPKTFRQKWTEVMSKIQLPSDIPSFINVIKHTGLNVTTNWATFFHQIDLAGFKHDFHMPVRSPDELTISVAGIPLYSACKMTIFKVNRDEHAAFSITYNDLEEDYFDHCEMFNQRFLS